MLRPNRGSTVCAAQAKQKEHHDEQLTLDQAIRFGQETLGQFTYVHKCISGVVLQSVGPVS